MAVTVQRTLYGPDGRLLGVAGIDVLLGTLGKLVEQITYQGKGHAFLVDGEFRTIYFPRFEVESRGSGPSITDLAALDGIFPESSGFDSLAQSMRTRTRGLERVRWRGEELIAVYAPVRAASPKLDWTLALMVPEELISNAIRRARSHTVLAILFAVATIGLLTLGVTNRIVAALRRQDRLRAEELAEANRELLEADRMKSRFLATMSHELRTPLNSIIGFSEILRTRLEGRLEPKFSRFLDNIHSSGEHLLALISDMLDLSKIEAGRMEIQPEKVCVERVLDGVCAIIRGVAKEHGITVRAEPSEQLPALDVDPVRFKQILYNLLSNAVKFSPESSTVRITVRELSALDSPLGLESLELSVIDSGIGISPENHEMIFEEFRQVDGPDGMERAGTGLGLALVRRLVELHHGAVSVESALGRGSTFTVVLPQVFQIGAGSAPALEPSLVADPGGNLVLIVEDDAAAFKRMSGELASWGYHTARSPDGSDAVELALRLSPAAIVLDIILPATNGWEILKQLKAREETRTIPVIVVSVLDNHELGMALGAEAYFTKPVDAEQLLERLADLVPRSGASQPNVLLIDDDPNVHDLLDEVLGPRSYSLWHPLSGNEGLRHARERRPHLIILDLMMEDMDGFEVASALRDDPATREIPVVVFTVRETTPQDREKLRGKIQALVQKGSGGPEALIRAIRNLLDRRLGAARQVASPGS